MLFCRETWMQSRIIWEGNITHIKSLTIRNFSVCYTSAMSLTVNATGNKEIDFKNSPASVRVFNMKQLEQSFISQNSYRKNANTRYCKTTRLWFSFFFTQNAILQNFVARSKIDAHDGTDGTRWSFKTKVIES